MSEVHHPSGGPQSCRAGLCVRRWRPTTRSSTLPSKSHSSEVPARFSRRFDTGGEPSVLTAQRLRRFAQGDEARRDEQSQKRVRHQYQVRWCGRTRIG